MHRRPDASKATAPAILRSLTEQDFEAVVEMDRRIVGRSRRGYMEKRLEAALRVPDAHVQLAAESGGSLVGFLLARIVEGEFGQASAAAVLEAIGVEPALQHGGVGRKLLERLEEVMRRRGIHELTTQAPWGNQPMLAFLEAAGFSLAPRLVLECSTNLATLL